MTARREFRQRIPRPDDAELVEEPEASFVRLPASERASLSRWDAVHAGIAGAEKAARDPAPVAQDPGARHRIAAAVLLPLLRGADASAPDEASLALIRRATHLRANPGEIAFPGGRIEPGESPLDAALRESYEEIGLPADSVGPLAALPPVARASRPEPIAAFAGAVHGAPHLAPDPAEVDDLLVTPLAELADPSLYWEEIWRRPDGVLWRMSFFELGDDLIWGASARILVSLFELFSSAK